MLCAKTSDVILYNEQRKKAMHRQKEACLDSPILKESIRHQKNNSKNSTIKIKFRTIIKITAQTRELGNGSTSWMVYKHIDIPPPPVQQGQKNSCSLYHPSIILPAVEPRYPWVTFVAVTIRRRFKKPQ